MKAKLYSKDGKAKGEVDLPGCFSSDPRPDILLKVYEAQKGYFMQPYGSKPGAGAGYSASGILKHRRHVWKTTYGRGISRIPRKIMARNGRSFTWIGATVASTRGGRRAHPPKSWKNLFRKINKKELRIALETGLRGTIDKEILKEKYGREIQSGFIFDSKIIKTKTKDFLATLKKVLKDSFDFALKKKKIRAGIGKMRGRKYKSNAGMLFIIGSKEEMKRKGIDVVKVNELSVKDLSPNGVAGRLACYTESAIKEIGERFK
ncbi:50S ribosomal protein L4 [Candidatus Pacearchaeota archaeon]|nr:MAG: 50S ribosomal protein L4 [Candidatus Pacearchaeota archaeon]